MATVFDAVKIVPSDRQLAWQKLEFYGFIHFGMNTFTNAEWGDGKVSPDLFNPTEFDADQWVATMKKAGMSGVILTCKHHDGFCLWPSAYTEYSLKNSPFQNGKGDIVRDVSHACKKAGLAFGIYLSPWDIHEPTYGKKPEYNDFFCNQLTELLTQYGELFSVWFDGACGVENENEKQPYDWERYYNLIRKHQPNACISVCGPDVRWCGNEAGYVRPSEWSVVPTHLVDNEKIDKESQKVDDETFRLQINSTDRDLGSREAIASAENLCWYPAEVNTSIRPGWFYHESEDNKVRSLDELMRIYIGSVGGNGTFLLNLPPDKRGLIHENDCQRLAEIGNAIRELYAKPIQQKATVCDKNGNTITGITPEKEKADYTVDWVGKEEAETITLKWDSPQTISHVILKENICKSQRIENFVIQFQGKELFRGTVVGYKKICKFSAPVTTDTLEISITQSRLFPTLSFVGVY